MPKIIKNLEENIFNAAFELFSEYGYKDVDMKMIAKKAGIAVGTLYNYYSNKKQLFMSVFENSWSNTYKLLVNVTQNDLSISDKITSFITVLYEEISKRKGLGGELIREHAFDEDYLQKFMQIRDDLQKVMACVIREFYKEKGVLIDKNNEKRIVIAVLILIFELKRQIPNEEEKNIDFIINMIDSFVVKKGIERS